MRYLSMVLVGLLTVFAASGEDAAKPKPQMTEEQKDWLLAMNDSLTMPRQVRRGEKSWDRDYDELKRRWLATMGGVLYYAAKYSESEKAVGAFRNNIDFVSTAMPTELAEESWRMAGGTPNIHLAKFVQQRQARIKALFENPPPIKFTALDGREVDVAGLRGKVVLIDFWATWCGPCMKEMPHIREMYDKYHSQGLEIVGVSCDYSAENVTGSYTAQYARSARQVLEFVREQKMPWPQHYEGRKQGKGGNTMAALFGVTGIPEKFLVDRQGRIIPMELRGEPFERQLQTFLAAGAK